MLVQHNGKKLDVPVPDTLWITDILKAVQGTYSFSSPMADIELYDDKGNRIDDPKQIPESAFRPPSDPKHSAITIKIASCAEPTQEQPANKRPRDALLDQEVASFIEPEAPTYNLRKKLYIF
jgi:hypothetical protein